MSLFNGLKGSVALAALIAVWLWPSLAAPALADVGTREHWIDYGEEEGDWIEVAIDDWGWAYVIVVEDYEVVEVLADKLGADNPNPLEGSGTSLNRDQLEDALRRKGARLATVEEFANTPLGRLLISRGATLETLHNPAEVGLIDSILGGGGGGFNPTEGSVKDQLRKSANSQGNGGEGDDGDDLKPGEAGLFDDEMPGPPELINPNPVRREDKGRNSGGLGTRAAPGAEGGGSQNAATR